MIPIAQLPDLATRHDNILYEVISKLALRSVADDFTIASTSPLSVNGATGGSASLFSTPLTIGLYLPNDTTKFLRGDGTWTTVPASFPLFTPGSVIFADGVGALSQDNANFFWDDALNRLGLATASPNATLDVRGTMRVGDDSHNNYPADSPKFYFATGTTNVVGNWTVTNAGGNGAQFTMRADGSGAGSKMVSANWLGTIGFRGKDDVGFASGSSALIAATATETWGSTAHGTKLEFGVTPNASTTRAVAMTIDQDGSVIAATALKITPMTTGSVLFAGASGLVSQDNATFFWDNTNKRLGIGTSPSYKLHVATSLASEQVVRAVHSATTGNNYGLVAVVTGATPTLNVGTYTNASGATTNRALVVTGTPASATNHAIYSDSAAQNYFAGNVGVGKSAPRGLLDVVGTAATYSALLVTTKDVNGVFNPEAFGARPDALTATGGVMTSGSATLTLDGSSGGSTFLAGRDEGKTIAVVGAGASGGILLTTITTVNSTTNVTLAATASTTVFFATTNWGTDSTSAFNTMLTNTVAVTGGNTRYQLQPGAYLITDELTVSATAFALHGAGKLATVLLFRPAGTAAKACLKLTGSNAVFTIADFGIEGPYACCPTYAIQFTAQTYYGCTLENLFINRVDSGLRYGSVLTSDMTMINCTILEPGTYGIAGVGGTLGLNIRGGLIYQYLRPYTVTTTNSSVNLSAAGFTFYQGMIGMRIAVAGAGTAGADLVAKIATVTSSTTATMDTAAGAAGGGSHSALIGPNTTAGIYMEQGGGYWFDCDVVGGLKPIWLNPGNGQSINFLFMTQMSGDSANGDGTLAITPTGTGVVSALKASNCWFASANASGIGASGAQVAAYVNSPGATSVRQLSFVGCLFGNSNKGGMYVNGATGVDLVGCTFDGNGVTSNTYPAAQFATVNGVKVDGCTFRHLVMTPGTTDKYSVQVDASVTGSLTLTDNVFKDWGTAAVLNSTTLAEPNLVIKGNAGLGTMGSSAYNSAAQSINNAAATALTFNTNLFDNSGVHSTSTNPTRFTVPTGMGGFYSFVGCVSFNTLAGGNNRQLQLWKNGATQVGQTTFPFANNAAPLTLELAWQGQLASGDYLELYAYQDSGAAANTVGGEPSTRGSLIRLS